MQFNNKIDIVFNAYNDVGEEIAGPPAELRCCVLAYSAGRDEADGAKTTKYDLKIIIAYRAFAPYNKIMSDDTATFLFEDKKYRVVVVNGIKDFSGKTKYFEIDLRQDKPNAN